ncbi:ribonuclease P protein component [Aquibacillus salsiterrae]|uniref:Ribonuclease P protein component n=1 Tax=Aquibacillus salsiterrae TaxID=2950439 RepID=A0A9X4AFJ2_9BACI|nr:ribonuclease P protein component [Aquibacillus salsiterrae]MDC3417729.1 ribonuclease P protein component [Aquibacillus salsiterrae]
MKKDHRLKKNEEFQIVFKNGKSFANRQLVLYYLNKSDQAHFRVGLSVSKKVGNAVTRNQIKRYLRQAFLELDEKIIDQYDLIVIARNPTNKMDFHQMKYSLVHLLSKTNLLKK